MIPSYGFGVIGPVGGDLKGRWNGRCVCVVDEEGVIGFGVGCAQKLSVLCI